MKKIVGLDLGTNSIGWAVVEQDFEAKSSKILGMGSRIIPMNQDVLDKFSGGAPLQTQTAVRTDYRGTRHLRERHLLRRERLHRVLNVLGFLPEHYAQEIDFKKHLGQFVDEKEPKIAWRKNQFGKYDFVFKTTFDEMLAEFKHSKPELFYQKPNGKETKIPYDWTVYYLRKKALEKAITKEELAWLILNFNQKRGYYQLRGEDDEKTDTKEYCALLKVVSVEKGEIDRKNDKRIWYKMTFENGWEYSATFVSEPNWLNTEREFLITEEYDENGNIKIVKDKKSDTTGKEKRKITPLPSFDEINLMSKKDQDKIYKKIKARTEVTINNSGKTVGTYIYETLLQNPTQKIRGKLVRTIERKFYKDELEKILKKQIELQSELFTENLYNDCVRELYRSNETHQIILSKRNCFVHLFVNDIIFYQRPLRSQKSTIGNCGLEFREYKDKNGKAIKEYLKVIPKSNPYYQEFRVWQWLYNLKIYTREDEVNVTEQFLKSTDDWVSLYDFLMSKKEVGNKDVIEFLLKYINKDKVEQDVRQMYPKLNDEKIEGKVTTALNKIIKVELPKYRWNYVFDNSKDKEEDKSKKYPCNSTGYEIRKRLHKVSNVPDNFLNAIDTKEVEITRKNEETGKREKAGEKITVSLDTREYQLWHIIYSVTDKKEYEEALESFAQMHSLFYEKKDEKGDRVVNDKCFVENFRNFPPFKSDYGSFSEKAIKKLLPLMRLGKYWSWENINEKSKERIGKILSGEYDETIKNRVREKAINLTSENDFQGLQLWLAQYIVYDRHSEAAETDQWKMSYDIQNYLYSFKQHSLRNPIVEQIITETLRLVKDAWEQEAENSNIHPVMVYDEHKKKKVKSYPNVFSEIHIELGRDMKNTKDERERLTKMVTDNEDTNLRIKAMLMEFANDDYFKNQEDYKGKKGETPIFYKKGNNPVKPYSQTQHDILKIYEEYVLKDHSEEDLKKEKTGITETKDGKTKEITIYDISHKSRPTKSQIEKYKLWLEQKYRSPYTGQMISLSKLFTPDYEIEHIIPKSRYFDDSLSNKVICEAAVNQKKDRQLGLEFIKNHYGQTVECGMGKTVKIFTEDEYTSFVKQHYSKNNKKRNNLLLEEIPEKMIERQMNDTRYLSKFISGLLSNIVREEKDDDGVNSKNLVSCNGKITTALKQDWGLNDVWNELILPRFERMNKLMETENFTSKNTEGHTIPAIPFELSKGFQKKRIDHRHHAMDALVIACATRNHVNYLNNKNAHEKGTNDEQGFRYDLKHMLCFKSKPDEKGNYKWVFKKPWGNTDNEVLVKTSNNFTADAKAELEKIVVSFKQNLRVINKATNKYEKIQNGKKIEVKQEKTKKGINWAIRKSLHKETVYAKVDLPHIKVPKDKIITAGRVSLDTSFDEEKIKTITDTGIQKNLNNYLLIIKNKLIQELENKKQEYIDNGKEEDYDKELNSLQKKAPMLAFSPEGIEDMNKNIAQYNDGKQHQPIFKVRTFEIGSRFALGTAGNKKDKYVEAAKGTNLFFAVYADKTGKRSYETIPLKDVIDLMKAGENAVPEINAKGDKLQFYLCPNDLVYVPTADEIENNGRVDCNLIDGKRIYKMVSSSGSQCFFIRQDIATSIVNKVEFSSSNKMEKAISGEMIKEICIKLRVDRLGNIRS